MEINMEILKDRLNELFKDDTQKNVGKKLYMTQGNVSKILSGNQHPSIDSLFYIAEAYGVSVDWLLGLSEKKKLDGVTSYVSSIEMLIHLYSKGAFEIHNIPFKEMHLIIKDPILIALIKKGSMFYNEDKETYRNWVENTLAALVDKPIVEMDDSTKRNIGKLCNRVNTGAKWLGIYEKAVKKEDIVDEELEFDYDML